MIHSVNANVTVRTIPTRPLEARRSQYLSIGMGWYHLGIVRENFGERFHASHLRNFHYSKLPLPICVGDHQRR